MSSEQDTAFNLPEASADAGGVVPAAPKQKRVLTEAQRLAFLKAREARARNLAIKREQKLATETAPEPAPKKPRAKRASPKPDVALPVEQPKLEPVIQPEVKPEPEPEPQPELDTQLLEEPIPMYPDPSEYAEMVADIIYKKLNAEELPAEPPVPPPKKPRMKRAKKVPVQVTTETPEPVAPTEQRLEDSVVKPTPSFSDPFQFDVPTKAFNWM